VKTIKCISLADLGIELAEGNEAERCAICLEDYEEEEEEEEEVVAKLECEHHYHARCVMRWVAGGRPTCPVCVMTVV
jgi:hypothetical protein